MTFSMKRLAGAATLAASILAAGAASAEAEFKLRWGHYLGNSPFVKVEQDFAKRVEEATNGRVEIDIVYSGGLGKGNELLTLAGRGAIDMASVVPGYYADKLLFWKAYQIPFIFDTPMQAMEISAESYQEMPVFKNELDKFRVHFLFHQPLGSYFLTGPDGGCTDLANLEGKKIRSFGADIPKIHAAVGAVPVSVGVGDVYEALQTGSLDYSFLNAGNILSNKLYEPGKFSCGPVMSITGHLIVMGKKTWNRLPADIQKIMTEEAMKSGKEYIEWIDNAESEAQKAAEAEGAVFKPIDADTMAEWRDKTPDLLQNWVDSMKERGRGDEAEAVAASWREKTGK